MPAAAIVVSPGQSIQAAVNHAQPGDTVLLKPGVYHQSVQIRTDGITLRGSGNSRQGTVLEPGARKPHTLCTSAFGVTGVCILAKKVNPKSGAVLRTVRNDSPHADTVVRDNVAVGNQFGIFVRHARHVIVFHNLATRNCEGILVLDDGQKGGSGNAAILRNTAVANKKFCPKTKDTPVNVKCGGILLLGATNSLVAHNAVSGNVGRQFNSGGIVVLSATKLTHGSNPNHDTIAANHAFRNRPADLIWDGPGVGVHFVANHCGTSQPAGLCH